MRRDEGEPMQNPCARFLFPRFPIALCLSLGAVAPACAQDGGYDASFGIGGRLLIDVSANNQDQAIVMRVLPDGAILMAGVCSRPEPPAIDAFPAFCATQLRADGSYDTRFGPGGVGYVRFDHFSNWPNNSIVTDVIRLTDGRLLFAGSGNSGGHALLSLLSADGKTLDSSIGGGNGFFDFQFNATSSFVKKLVQQPDGKILVVGAAVGPNGNMDMAVARFLPGLSALDTTFGTGGYQTVAFDLGGPSGNDEDGAESMALQRDGAIILAGFAVVGPVAPTGTNVAIARLLANGQLDSSFGPAHDGRVHLAFAAQSAASDVLIDRRGRLLIGGISANAAASGLEWLIDRLLTDGSQDPTFNAGAAQRFLILDSITAGLQHVTQLALQSDGRILAGGTVARDNGTDTNEFFGVARLDADGSFDTGFGAANGRSYGLFGFSSYTDNLIGIALTNGGLMVGGWAGQTLGSGDDQRFALVKLKSDLIFQDGLE